jgi:hypothetical protein
METPIMLKTTFFAALLLLTSDSILADDKVCPCVPLTYEWVASPCETWECAQAALAVAHGDPYVVAMPTAGSWKWVVLRRVVSGSFIVSPESPFGVELFDGVAEASARFASLDHDALPILMSTVDGKMVVVSLRPSVRRRAVGPR